MYNLQLVEDRILSIATDRGLSKNKISVEATGKKGFFDSLKVGKVPSIEKIHKVANYLNCSIDYLVGRTDAPIIAEVPSIENSLSKDENRILDLFNSLSEDNKTVLIGEAIKLKREQAYDEAVSKQYKQAT
ncbi:MAG: hypothetical protein LIO87_02680 [Eubacterium sp.]|nr:hypothetical protein [Eubacterium sp.]